MSDKLDRLRTEVLLIALELVRHDYYQWTTPFGDPSGGESRRLLEEAVDKAAAALTREHDELNRIRDEAAIQREQP